MRELALFASLISIGTSFPIIEGCNDCSNIGGRFQPSLPNPATSAGDIYYLGSFNSEKDCSNVVKEGSRQYYSYTWFSAKTANTSYENMCYAVATNKWDWFPHGVNQAFSGRLFYGCDSEEDCALNGKCNKQTKQCLCNSGWTGLACTRLDERPTKSQNGFQFSSEGVNHSSWGGAILKSDETFHMYSSLMTHKCGLDSWATNSKIIHATSDNILGPYKYDGSSELFPVFSHEPDVKVINKNNGEVGIFFTMRNPDKFPLCDCTNGTTPKSCNLYPAHPDKDPTYVSTATNHSGPWSTPIAIMKDTFSDSNLTPLLNEDGSLIGLWRSFYNHSYSRIHLVTASDYKDPSTYKYNVSWSGDLFNLGGPTEDPFLFKDSDGYYHAIFHNMYGCMPCGGHAFSKDGFSWTYTGGDSYGWSYLVGDTKYDVVRRERPHLVFNDQQVPIALSTGVIPGGDTQDYSFTLVVPLGSQ